MPQVCTYSAESLALLIETAALKTDLDTSYSGLQQLTELVNEHPSLGSRKEIDENYYRKILNEANGQDLGGELRRASAHIEALARYAGFLNFSHFQKALGFINEIFDGVHSDGVHSPSEKMLAATVHFPETLAPRIRKMTERCTGLEQDKINLKAYFPDQFPEPPSGPGEDPFLRIQILVVSEEGLGPENSEKLGKWVDANGPVLILWHVQAIAEVVARFPQIKPEKIQRFESVFPLFLTSFQRIQHQSLPIPKRVEVDMPRKPVVMNIHQNNGLAIGWIGSV